MRDFREGIFGASFKPPRLLIDTDETVAEGNLKNSVNRKWFQYTNGLYLHMMGVDMAGTVLPRN